MAKKRRHYILLESQILTAVKLFGHSTQFLLLLYFFGVVRRVKAFENLFPKIEREGKVKVSWHDGRKVYLPKRKYSVRSVSIEHELAWVEILIRLWRCRMGESEIIPERTFRGFGIVPECGIRYSEERNSMLNIEFSTNKNFTRQSGGVIKSKLTRYRKYLPDMEAFFSREITVLFVIDAERVQVKEFVPRIRPYLDSPVVSGNSGKERFPFFFTDFETFKNVPVGKALTASIYFWRDGKEYPLSNHE